MVCLCYSNVSIYRVLSKSSRTRSKKKCWPNLLILAVISFRVVSLGTYTVVPLFFPRFKSTLEVIFLNALEYRLRFPLDVGHCFKTSSFQFHFQFGKQIQLSSPIMILQIKVGSSLAFSHSSRHVYALLFLPFVKSLGTNFAAMRRTFKFSVKIFWQTP
jgi:hypothetical protein